jgi:hypothetical protein
VSTGGAPADLDGGRRSFRTRAGPGPADGDGHGLPDRRRWCASSGTVQEPGASRTGRLGVAGGSDATSPKAFAERRRQRLRTRGVHVGAARIKARSGRAKIHFPLLSRATKSSGSLQASVKPPTVANMYNILIRNSLMLRG